MCTLAQGLSNWYGYFVRLLGFPDCFAKYHCSLLNYLNKFRQEQCKQKTLINFNSFVANWDNGYNDNSYYIWQTFSFFIKILKRKKKGASTNFVFLSKTMIEWFMKTYWHWPMTRGLHISKGYSYILFLFVF